MVSIIIATKNEQKNLPGLLRSIKRQTYRNYEIIVVDNYSQDRTQAIARNFNVKVFLRGSERSSQRNLGITKSKGDFVLFLDADMELEPDLLQESVNAMKQKSVAAVVISETVKGQGFISKVKRLEKELISPKLEAARFFRREDLVKIGGYNEDLISGEDWDITIRVRKLGKIARVNSKIVHWENQSLISDLKKKYYYAKNIHNYAAVHPRDFGTQSSAYHRSKILFLKPKLMLKHPFEFSMLLILKTGHYIAYLIATNEILIKLRFSISKINEAITKSRIEAKRLNMRLKSGGLMSVLLKDIPQLILFIFGHFKYRYLKKNPGFVFNGKKYNYFYSLYNFTYFGERCVEIPIIWEEVKKNRDKMILEVGNVLSHYFAVSHDIVDKYESVSNVQNIDITKYKSRKQYDLIVSISTIEHIGWDERKKNPKKITLALQNIKNLLSKNGHAIITLPIGYNRNLDTLLKTKRNNLFDKIYNLKRISKNNRWKQVNFEAIEGAKFNTPYPFANAIIIGIIKK